MLTLWLLGCEFLDVQCVVVVVVVVEILFLRIDCSVYVAVLCFVIF